MKKLLFTLLIFISFLSFNSFILAEETEKEPVMPTITYSAHVQDIGWLDPVSSGIAGTEGKAKHLECLKISAQNLPANLRLQMQAHVSNLGWLSPTYNSGDVGTTGQNLPLESIKLSFINTNGTENAYDIYYRCHVSNIGWLDWAKDGEISGTTGLALPLEAVEIVIIPKDQPAPGPTTRSSISGEELVNTTHVRYTLENPLQVTSSAADGEQAGTTGQGIPMFFLSAELECPELPSSGIVYQAYSADVGWCPEASGNIKSGVLGCQIESIKMNLTGPIANFYDIYYQAHIANCGWMDWAKNGELSGSAEGACSLQALRVKLVRKGQPAPGSTYRPYLPVPRGVCFQGRGILVSIPLQMVFIQNEQNQIIFMADCVTGQPDAGYDRTPYGNFSILAKSRNTYLSGPGYYTHVDYWIPFIGSVWGFHDADWRQDWEFGRDVYLTDPSSGCVNMRDREIAIFNNLIRIGDPVYVR